MTAVGGLALPTGDMNDDAIAYHYLGPRVWLREGVIRPVPDEIQTSFPVVVETQYAALMSLGGLRAPEFFAVIALLCLLLMTGSLAIRLGLDSTGAWWAAALVATMPAVYRGAYGGFLDALLASFVLAAARMAYDAERPGHFALFGIFCGIAMGTKYQGIVAWGLLVASSFLVSLLGLSPKSRIRPKMVGSCMRHRHRDGFPFLPAKLDFIWLSHLSRSHSVTKIFCGEKVSAGCHGSSCENCA